MRLFYCELRQELNPNQIVHSRSQDGRQLYRDFTVLIWGVPAVRSIGDYPSLVDFSGLPTRFQILGRQ
jgi:hypothetical protein